MSIIQSISCKGG